MESKNLYGWQTVIDLRRECYDAVIREQGCFDAAWHDGSSLVLLNPDQISRRGRERRRRRLLRGAPGIENRNLVHARNRAMRCAGFLRDVLAA